MSVGRREVRTAVDYTLSDVIIIYQCMELRGKGDLYDSIHQLACKQIIYFERSHSLENWKRGFCRRLVQIRISIRKILTDFINEISTKEDESFIT